jgi:hypothetical protein
MAGPVSVLQYSFSGLRRSRSTLSQLFLLLDQPITAATGPDSHRGVADENKWKQAAHHGKLR